MAGRGQVDDGEAQMAEAHPGGGIGPDARGIRSAMRDRIAHATGDLLEALLVGRRATIPKTGYAAHGSILFMS
ncbi:MAG: hypothetical protein BroJett029_23370 [Alphaproteobacteria bacterium]|nr:MAG: hypothetical protein BroJett029_23370 [Alphaproteobacteria bacterium]